ncbi:MAG: hypothetical protein QXO86_05830 [Nitrososphaerota archaeon]
MRMFQPAEGDVVIYRGEPPGQHDMAVLFYVLLRRNRLYAPRDFASPLRLNARDCRKAGFSLEEVIDSVLKLAGCALDAPPPPSWRRKWRIYFTPFSGVEIIPGGYLWGEEVVVSPWTNVNLAVFRLMPLVSPEHVAEGIRACDSISQAVDLVATLANLKEEVELV